MTTREKDSPSEDKLKAEKALQFFMAGYPYYKIANALDYKDEATVKTIIEDTLEERDLDSLNHKRLLEYFRLEEIHKEYWNTALKGIGPDQLHATRIILRIARQRAKLLGLDKKSNIQAGLEREDRITVIWDPFDKHKK